MLVINSSSTSFIPRACTVPAVRPKKDFKFKTIIVNQYSIIDVLNAAGSSMPGRAPSSRGPTGGPRRWSSSCAVLLRGCPPPSWPGNSHVAEGISWILDTNSKHKHNPIWIENPWRTIMSKPTKCIKTPEKKGSHTRTRRIRPGVGPTRSRGTGRWKTTVLPWSGSSAESLGRCGWRSWRIRIRRHWKHL